MKMMNMQKLPKVFEYFGDGWFGQVWARGDDVWVWSVAYDDGERLHVAMAIDDEVSRLDAEMKMNEAVRLLIRAVELLQFVLD